MILRRFAPMMTIAALWVATSGCNRGSDERETRRGAPPATATVTAPAPAETAETNAHDGGGYLLYRPPRWQVGDVVTNEMTANTTGHITRSGSDGKTAQSDDFDETLEATWLEKCGNADADGRCSEYLVSIREWVRTRGDLRDDTLEGTSVRVAAPSPPKRSWSFMEQKHPPSAEGRRWLDEHFGPRAITDEYWLRLTLPPRRVSVGQSWTPDTPLLASVFESSGMAIDPAKLATTITLDAADAETARCSFKVSVPLLRLPNAPPTAKQSGVLQFAGDMTVPLGKAPLVVSRLQRQLVLEGEATQDSVTSSYRFDSDERRTTTPGGSFPETDAGEG